MDTFAERFQESTADLSGSQDVGDPDGGVHGGEEEFVNHSGSHAVEGCRCGTEPTECQEQNASCNEDCGEPAEHAGEDIAFAEEPE